jgi:hypothetical protein
MDYIKREELISIFHNKKLKLLFTNSRYKYRYKYAKVYVCGLVVRERV